MIKKIRLATIGTGYFSRFQYSAWARIPEVELVGICNRNLEGAQDVANEYNIADIFTDFELMLDTVKPTLVDIITPPITHEEYVLACVKRNIPVICQKPFTPSLDVAISLSKKIEEKNAKVIIHENFRFQPWYHKIKEVLENEMLGDLYQISSKLRPGDGQGPEAYKERQPYFQQMERFLIHETTVHLIDVFRYLFGEMISLFADLRRVNPVIKGEDAGLIIFNFANGTRGIFDGNRLSDHQATNRRLTMGEMQIEGSLGTLSLNGDADIFFREHGENTMNPIEYKWKDCDFGGDCVYRLQRHVIDHLLYGTELMNSANDYLRNIIIVDTIYSSDKMKKSINIGTSASN